MKADVYLSNPRKRILLITLGRDLSSLPDEIQKIAAGLKYEGQWDITPAPPRWGLDYEKAIKSLQENGYYTTTASIRAEIINP
jgi:hypothetical protein